MCVCVCVCVREREIDREGQKNIWMDVDIVGTSQKTEGERNDPKFAMDSISFV